jgi:hypothetical protein
LCQLANFFPDFHFWLPQTKNGVVAPAPLLPRKIPEFPARGKSPTGAW